MSLCLYKGRQILRDGGLLVLEGSERVMEVELFEKDGYLKVVLMLCLKAEPVSVVSCMDSLPSRGASICRAAAKHLVYCL